MELIIRLDNENKKTMKKSVVKNEMINEGKLIVTDSFRYETEKGCISLLKPCHATFQSLTQRSQLPPVYYVCCVLCIFHTVYNLINISIILYKCIC